MLHLYKISWRVSCRWSCFAFFAIRIWSVYNCCGSIRHCWLSALECDAWWFLLGYHIWGGGSSVLSHHNWSCVDFPVIICLSMVWVILTSFMECVAIVNVFVYFWKRKFPHCLILCFKSHNFKNGLAWPWRLYSTQPVARYIQSGLMVQVPYSYMIPCKNGLSLEKLLFLPWMPFLYSHIVKIMKNSEVFVLFTACIAKYFQSFNQWIQVMFFVMA